MSPWLIWLIVALFFAILEMFTTGFMVIWLSIAAFVALAFSLIFPEAIVIQITIFGILSIILLLFTKKFADKVTSNTIPTNVYSVIGKKANVIVEINSAKSTGQVKVDGDVWSAKAEEFSSVIPVNTVVEIVRVDGVKVVVKTLE